MSRNEAGQFQAGESGNPLGRPRKQVQRRDGWINDASGHGTTRDRRTLTRYGVDVVTDLEALMLWRSEWLCARVIETRPREAFRRGYELKVDDKKRAEKVVAMAEAIGVDAAFVKAGQYERAFGGAAIFPVLDGAIGDLATPLDEQMVREVRALHVLEPRQLQPVQWYTDLAHPKFGQPEVWRFMPLAANRAAGMYGQLIHESRLVIFPGLRVSVQTQPGQREGWGDSELSKCYGAIRDFGMSWGSATTILHNFGRDVLQLKDWAEIATQDDADALMSKRLSAFEMANSTLRVGVLDADDKFTPRGGSLAGLSDTLIQQAQYVAAATEHPVTVLMGMSPAGLNATGDMDVRNWYATIENDQATKYRHRLEHLYRLLLLVEGGVEPDAWSCEFRALLTPSEKEEAERRKIIADTDVAYVNAGIVTEDDVAESRWKGDTFSAEMTVDWARREKAKKEREEREAMMAEAATLRPALPAAGDEKAGDENPDKSAPPTNEE